MENQMIESLLNEIFLKKDSNTKPDSAGTAGQAAGAAAIYRPNYQRSRNHLHVQPAGNDDVDVFDMMREYMK